MPAHLPFHRWLPVVAVAAVCIAAVGTALFGARESAPASTTRPDGSAQASVVRAPAPATPQAPGCATCAMGAGRSTR